MNDSRQQPDVRRTKPQSPDRRFYFAASFCGRRHASLLVILCLVFGVFTPPFVRAQTNAASESRYLLIFDTSAAMKRRAENVQRVAGELIYGGMNGQMHAGDSIGIWTFNEALHAGNLPLLRWAPDRRKNVATKVTEFLRTQKYEKESRLEVVLDQMHRLATNSAKLTILLFSDGSGKFSGTPFDDEIYAAYQPFLETQKKERMPFTTVLRVKGQEFLGYAVTPAPWVVEFPSFPPDPVVVTPKVEPKPGPVRPVVPPLIVIGKKDTNAPPAVELPPPGAETRPPGKAGMTEAEKLFAKLAAEQGLTVQPADNPNATAQPTSTPPPPTGPPPENSKPAPVPGPAVIKSPKPTPPPTERKVPPAASIANPASAPIGSNAPAAETQPPPALQAVVVPVDKPATRLLLVAGGVSVLLVALGVAYALMRRRQRAHVSLITSSMDRSRK